MKAPWLYHLNTTLFTLFILFPNLSIAQNRLKYLNFSDSSQFYLQQFDVEASKSYSFNISKNIKKDGNLSGRFELRYGDPKIGLGVRVEISYNKISTYEVWAGFSLYLPNSFIPDTIPEGNFQIHTFDTLEKADISPPIQLANQDGHTFIWIDYSQDDHPSVYNYTKKSIDLGVTKTGCWIDYVFHTKIDITNGFLQVWRNGIRVVNYFGPVGYKYCRPPLIKFGIYKWGWANGPSKVNDRVVYFDDIRIADSTSSYNNVKPN